MPIKKGKQIVLTEKDLKFWIDNNMNVLFIGKHGVGKTAIATSALEKHGLRWKYFSASTMDPWVDFIGVPKEQDYNGVKVLGLIRPKEFAFDEIEALIFDEFNRSPKKVKNAVMELIQFKSINGHKFNNLRFIWAAINPEDDDDLQYDVEPLDPAQKDRFHVHIYLPYEPNKDYFINKFGTEVANAAIQWWDNLSNDIKGKLAVSPRRLDYALQMFTLGGNLRDVLPVSTNISALLYAIGTGDLDKELEAALKQNDAERIKEFINEENKWDHLRKKCESNIEIYYKVADHMPKEKFMSILPKSAPEINNALQAKQIKPEELQAMKNTDIIETIIHESQIFNQNRSKDMEDFLGSFASLAVTAKDHKQFAKYALLAVCSMSKKSTQLLRKNIYNKLNELAMIHQKELQSDKELSLNALNTAIE